MRKAKISLLVAGCILLLAMVAGCSEKKNEATDTMALSKSDAKKLDDYFAKEKEAQEKRDKEAKIPDDYPQELPLLVDDAFDIYYNNNDAGTSFQISFSTMQKIADVGQLYNDYITKKGFDYKEDDHGPASNIYAKGEMPDWKFKLSVILVTTDKGDASRVDIEYFK